MAMAVQQDQPEPRTGNRTKTLLGETKIPVNELARIVNGGRHRKLFEPLATGVWLRVHIDTVLTLDQQYQP